MYTLCVNLNISAQNAGEALGVMLRSMDKDDCQRFQTQKEALEKALWTSNKLLPPRGNGDNKRYEGLYVTDGKNVLASYVCI